LQAIAKDEYTLATDLLFALLIWIKWRLKLAEIHRILMMRTAKDLGPKGRDRESGAGLADAVIKHRRFLAAGHHSSSTHYISRRTYFQLWRVARIEATTAPGGALRGHRTRDESKADVFDYIECF
jgi:hypothetical protein